MKILVQRNEQQPEVTIDLKGVRFAYAIRNAIQLALEIDGFTKETIDEVLGRYEDCNTEVTNEKL